MNLTKTIALAAVMSATAFGGAHAADTMASAPAMPATTPVFDEPGFDWEGFYAGVNGGGQYNDEVEQTDFTLGGQIGANYVFDYFLLGAELGVDAVFEGEDETYAFGQALGRAGAVVTDTIVVYGALGYGSDFDADNGPGDHALAGAGAEFALTDNVSLDGRYLYGFGEDEGAASQNTDTHEFTLGANFHF